MMLKLRMCAASIRLTAVTGRRRQAQVSPALPLAPRFVFRSRKHTRATHEGKEIPNPRAPRRHEQRRHSLAYERHVRPSPALPKIRPAPNLAWQPELDFLTGLT